MLGQDIPKLGKNVGLTLDYEGLKKFSIDSPVRWEHCGHPVPEMEPDTEHRQCPHEGEEPHNYPDCEDRWEAADEKPQGLQLHQVPTSGLATAVSLRNTNLKENFNTVKTGLTKLKHWVKKIKGAQIK